MKKLLEKDLKQIEHEGIREVQVLQQLDNFEKGFPFVDLNRAATVGDGILHITEQDVEKFIDYFEQNRNQYSMLKFVPASGAASRMFKDLVLFQQNSGQNTAKTVMECMTHLNQFAFYDQLSNRLQKDGLNVEDLERHEDYKTLADYILNESGLNYQHLPKAMLLFHKYKEGPRSAFGEHLMEGAEYARNLNDNTVRMEFTISPEHRELFEQKKKSFIPKLEEQLGVHFDIRFTEQKARTKAVALTPEGTLARNSDGSLLLRPGGHGALIENLNECDADLVFIKNIDNVTVDRMKESTYRYKKVLAGYLMSLQEETFRCLEKLDSLSLSSTDLALIESFAFSHLNIQVSMRYYSQSLREKVAFLHQKLNRPIRVCGMVRNEGEPGGGPYWVRDKKGEISLQIIEASQIDFNNRYQVESVQKSSHFNPVDLVCGLKNYRGNRFNLKNYVDYSTGFISTKTQNGVKLKIQELPGLWNGSMANWISIFVEVPLETFTPVKTLNDLLRDQHQG